jgi:hypothetical protein
MIAKAKFVLLLIFGSIGLMGPALAQPAGDRWVLLDAREIDPARGLAHVDLTSAQGRFKALRIDVTAGSLDVTGLRIRYNDGVQYTEVRRVNLKAGDRTRNLARDGQERFVDRLTVEFALAPAGAASTRFEVWGLQSPAGALAVRGATPADKKGAETAGAPPPVARPAPESKPKPMPAPAATPPPPPPVAAAPAP